MPSAYIEDTVRAFTTRQEKLRVELEQLQASARRLPRQPASGSAPEERIREVKRVIAALGAAVKTLGDDQMMLQKSPHSLTDTETSVQATFMSLAAKSTDATYGRIQGSDVLDPAE
jgi:uncharacterized membrane protein YccC